jgi:hypothetical protein
MSEPAKKKATHDDLFSIPENMTGQIIVGDLPVTPRGGDVTPLYRCIKAGLNTPGARATA